MVENAVIGKVILDFGFESERGYSHFCDLIEQEHQEEFLEILNQVFDKVPIKRTIVLNQLTVDVGNINSKDFDEFFETLKLELQKLIDYNNNFFSDNEKSSFSETLVFYVQNGYLPWWASSINSLRPKTGLTPADLQLLLQNAPELLENKNKFSRFYNAMTAADWDSFVQRYTKFDRKLYRSLIQLFSKIIDHNSIHFVESRDTLIKELSYEFLALKGETSISFTQVFRVLIQKLSIKTSLTDHELKALVSEQMTSGRSVEEALKREFSKIEANPTFLNDKQSVFDKVMTSLDSASDQSIVLLELDSSLMKEFRKFILQNPHKIVKSIKERKLFQAEYNLEKLLYLMGDSVSAIYENFLEPQWAKNYEEVLALFSEPFFNNFLGQSGDVKNIPREVQKFIFKTVFAENKFQFKDDFKKILQLVSEVSSLSMSELIFIFQNKWENKEVSSDLKKSVESLLEEEQLINGPIWSQLKRDLIESFESNIIALFDKNEIAVSVVKRSIQDAYGQFPLGSLEQFENFELFLELNFETLGKHFKMSTTDLKTLLQNQLIQGEVKSKGKFLYRYLMDKASSQATDLMAQKYNLTAVLWHFDRLEMQFEGFQKSMSRANTVKNRRQRDPWPEIDSVVLSLRYLKDHAAKTLVKEQLKKASKSRNQTTSVNPEIGLLYHEISHKSQDLLTKFYTMRSLKESKEFEDLSKTVSTGGGTFGEISSFDEIYDISAFKKSKWSLIESAQILAQLKRKAERLERILLKGSSFDSTVEEEQYQQIRNLMLQSLSLKTALEEDVRNDLKKQSSQKLISSTPLLSKEVQKLYNNLIFKAKGIVNSLQSLEIYAKRKGILERELKNRASNIRVQNLKSVFEFNRLVTDKDLATSLKDAVARIATSNSMLRKQSEKDDNQILLSKSSRNFDQLDRLLSLNSNVAYDWVTNFEDLISDPNLMLQFLSDHKGNQEALLLFSDISLDELYTNAIKDIFNQIDDRLILIEEFLLEIQSKYILATLSTANFRRIIRLLLAEFLSENTVFRTIDVEEFGFRVMTYFASNKRLDYKQVQLFSNLNSSSANLIENSLLQGINIFLERFLFQSVGSSVQYEIHYKDVVYYYLQNGHLPSWSNISSIKLSDALNYLEVRISKGDADFVKLVFDNKAILDKIMDRLSLLSEDLKYDILELLQARGSAFQLGNFFKAFLEFFGATRVSKISENSTYLFQFIVENKLWQASYPLSYFQFNFFSAQEDLNSFLTHFKVKKWPDQVQLKKSTEAENQLLINLYLESLGSDALDVLWNEKMIEQLKTYFSKTPKAIKTLLVDLTNPSVINPRLFDLAPSQNVLFNQLRELISHKSVFSTGLHQIIFDSIESYALTTDAAVDLTKLIFVTLVKGENDDKKYFVFLDKLALINPQLFDFVLTSIKEVQSNKKHPLFSVLSSKDIDSLNSLKPNRTLEMAKKQDWESFQYFLAFDSLNYQGNEEDNISDIIMRILIRDAVRLRKLLHSAGRSPGKLKKIIDLLKIDQAEKLMNLIHDQFHDFIEEANAFLIRTYKTSIKKSFDLKTKRQEIVFYFEFWSANSDVFINEIKFLEEMLFVSLEALKIRPLDFVQLIEQDKTRLSRTQQLVLEAMSKSLKDKAKVVDKTRQIESGSTLEALGLNDEDSIYIRNAGLVIAWPYLNTLFDKCGYLEGNKFKNIESRDRAVMLSQYLVLGTDTILEEDLPLNKLLLGIPLFEFVDTSLSLTDFEKSLGDSLLKGIIGNWTTLGNTSIEGLRETFLNREGALVKKEMDYKLKVKTETFDVLIPTIPWNISMIQTSFMNFRLLVEWK